MPELPEVQTVVSDLNKKIKGDTIVDFWSDWEKTLKNISLEKFRKEIRGRKILGARRIGKNIFIDLSGGKTLFLHLKMTGHLLVKNQKNIKALKQKNKKHDYFSDKVNKYIHHIWYLKSNKLKANETKSYLKTLEFSDMRKFAKIVLVDTDKINTLPEIEKLGIDAVSPEFTFKKFDAILNKKSKSPIGIVLMDQHLIAGIGNIYRSEILFEAGVDPRRLSVSLSSLERKKIFKAIGKILNKAIFLRGTTDSDYRDTDGAPGGFQKVLRVYNKKGDRCKKCGTIIERFKLGQRSVFYCPKCQH